MNLNEFETDRQFRDYFGAKADFFQWIDEQMENGWTVRGIHTLGKDMPVDVLLTKELPDGKMSRWNKMITRPNMLEAIRAASEFTKTIKADDYEKQWLDSLTQQQREK